MTEKRRIPLAEAERLAAELVELLSPACERIAVAGSIRRRRPDIGDVEICCIPKRTPSLDLFGGETGQCVNLLVSLTDDLLAAGVLQQRLDVNGRPAWGEWMRRATYKGFGVDLFSGLVEQWGVLLAIRTGNADFSHLLVTPRNELVKGLGYGFCQPWAQFKGWRVVHRQTGEALETPEEVDVFNVLSLPYPEPHERTGSWRPVGLGIR